MTTPRNSPGTVAAWRAGRRAARLCIDCPNTTDGRSRCDTCREKYRGINRRRREAGKVKPYRTPPTRVSWTCMMGRCFDPKNAKFHAYGGRGVTVCERWCDYRNFLADMGERPAGRTLDRIDPYGDYEPGNCRWATPLEQARNKRRRDAPEGLKGDG